MPKRKITEVKEHGVYGIYPLLREEYAAYEEYKKETEKLKTVKKENLVHETASLFIRRYILEQISNNIDAAIEESEQTAEGETVADDENSRSYIEASNALTGMNEKGTFEFVHQAEIRDMEKNVARIYEVAGMDEPLPVDFLIVASQPDLDDDAIKYYVDLHKQGKPLFEEDTNLDARLIPEEPEPEVEEVKDEEKEEQKEDEKVEEKEEKKEDEKVEEKADGNGNDDNEGEKEEEEEKEEKLNEEQVEARRKNVDGIVKNFFQKWMDAFEDPIGAIKELSIFGFNPYMLLIVGGQKLGDLYKEEMAIENPEERQKKVNEALKKEIEAGDKQITFIEPEVLTNGKVVPGREVVLSESKENLQVMADNNQKYNILLDQQLKEFNHLKEEFGKTQNLPKANFDGKNKEGSDYYQNMTSSLDRCITMLEEVKSGKVFHSAGALQGAYNQFKNDCQAYVEKRQGRLFGPVTDNGKQRLALGLNGGGKVTRMINEIDQYTDKITSKVIVNGDGKTFDRLNSQEQTEYVNKLAEDGKVKLKPEAEVEHEICLGQLRKINTLDYALRDYSNDKNGKYMEAAQGVILGIHNNIVNHGQKATNYDVNRIRNFDLVQKDMAENPVFRSMVDREGIKKTAEKWPEIEQKTDALRNSIRDDYENRLTETKQAGDFTYKFGMSPSEYVSGIGSRENRSAENQVHTPESKIRELSANPAELDKAYDRMTSVITDKLLLENDKFGKEFLNAQVSSVTGNMTVNDVDVRTQLNHITKQILVQNHVLEGKKLPKALEQLESGKLGEDLVNSVKEVYKKEQKKGKTMDISAERQQLDMQLQSQGLTRTEQQQKAYDKVHKMQDDYIKEAREQRDSLAAEGTGYTKNNQIDQEKIQKMIKASCGEYVARNRDKFITRESIDKFERSFYQNQEARAGLFLIAAKHTGQEIADMIKENRTAKELSNTMQEVRDFSKKKFEPISKEAREANPELLTKRENEIKEAKQEAKFITDTVKASGELKMPESLKEKQPVKEQPNLENKAGGPAM